MRIPIETRSNQQAVDWHAYIQRLDERARRDLVRHAKKQHFDLTHFTWTVASFRALCAEWDCELNESSAPTEVTFRSERVVWWKCAENGHQWQAAPVARIHRNADTGYVVRRCPMCDRASTPLPERSVAHRYPELVREWDQQRNGRLYPSEVASMSNKKVWWRCVAGHSWITAVKHRTWSAAGCPRCASEPRADNTLAVREPALAAQWHPDRNGRLTPLVVSASSSKKVWWKCGAASDHEWLASPATRRRARGCPFCLNHRVSTSNSLAVKFPSIARQWHPSRNGTLTPRAVVASSTREVWWLCSGGPDHEWLSTVRQRTLRNPTCPYCEGKLVSLTNCLATRYPAIAEQWHPSRNAGTTPFDVVASSRTEVWWCCPAGHEWLASIHSRTALRRACPVCANTSLQHVRDHHYARREPTIGTADARLYIT